MDIKNLFEYELWANDEMIKYICSFDDTPEKVISLMSHILNAQIVWLSRIQGIEPWAQVWQNYNKQNLQSVNKDISEKIELYIKNMNDTEPDRAVTYTNTKGEKYDSLVRDILAQVLFHSAYHRGQIVTIMKALTDRVPYTDYIHFVRNIKQSKNNNEQRRIMA